MTRNDDSKPPPAAETGASGTGSAGIGSAGSVDRFVYDDRIVRAFLGVTMLWSVVALLVGILVALQLAFPKLNLGLSFTSFGRLRPLHTNAAIFAFAGNAIFVAVYHSTQRLCKARMFSSVLSCFHFIGWQLIIVAAYVANMRGKNIAGPGDEVERRDGKYRKIAPWPTPRGSSASPAAVAPETVAPETTKPAGGGS